MCLCVCAWAIWSHKHLQRAKITCRRPLLSCCVYSLSAFMTAFLRHRPQVIMGFPVGWSGGMVVDGDICGELCDCFFLFCFFFVFCSPQDPGFN